MCRNITTHNNKDERHSSQKNIPLTLFERVLCERELETEQNCNILITTLMAISVSFPFSWAAQPGAQGQASLGASFLYRILSPTRLIPNWSDLPTLNRGPEGSLCWGLTFSTASCLQLIELPVHCYITVQRSPSSCGHHRLHSFNLSTVKATLYSSSTGCTCYLHWCISYFDSPAGSQVNIQHKHGNLTLKNSTLYQSFVGAQLSCPQNCSLTLVDLSADS